MSLSEFNEKIGKILGKFGAYHNINEFKILWKTKVIYNYEIGLRYCPLCLKQDKEPFFRKIWRLRYIPFCFNHNCFLEETCPICNRLIDNYMLRWGAFNIKNCSKCNADLSYTKPEFIKINDPLLKNIPWRGANLLKDKCFSILPIRGLTNKGLEMIKLKVYSAWRAIIRSFRKNLTELKSGFQDAKYLVVMNPIYMKDHEKRALRKSLKKSPWLRPIRRIMTKFYYQFHLSPVKRSSLKFLLAFITENCHSWLKSAVNTLIKHEEQVFRFQVLIEKNPALKRFKSIKVADESTMRKINTLYHRQFGMRTVDTLEMRLIHYLDCPFIIAPSVLEELKK